MASKDKEQIAHTTGVYVLNGGRYHITKGQVLPEGAEMETTAPNDPIEVRAEQEAPENRAEKNAPENCYASGGKGK